ncbi:MAG: DUF3795 domain-containing protein, partial [Candidatus Thorarchaeota archaeon]
MAPQDILCDGCMAKDPKLIDNNCPVRPCVIEKGIENCSDCEQYTCDRLNERLVIYEEILQKMNGSIPEDD